MWKELTADPARQLWFKQSDHFVIARYCDLEARRRQMADKTIDPTYRTKSTSGETVIKANPMYGAYMKLHAELRLIEAQIGGTPMSRMNIAHKMGTVGDPAAPRMQQGQPKPDDKAASKSPSPIGVLKSHAGSSPPPGGKPN